MSTAQVDRAPATPGQLLAAMSSYGHFTAMQVRGGRVRGLDDHLRRLTEATRTLFGHELDTERVRGDLRHAVAGRGAVSVRILVHAPPADGRFTAFGDPQVTVVVHDPVEPGTSPLRVRSVRYERDLPRVKHLGAFGLGYHLRQAGLAGYDDAVFVDSRGRISEASIRNVGFHHAGTVYWPDPRCWTGSPCG